jgi:hypothetical protein
MACGLIMDGKPSETMLNHLEKCQRIDRQKFEKLAAHDNLQKCSKQRKWKVKVAI